MSVHATPSFDVTTWLGAPVDTTMSPAGPTATSCAVTVVFGCSRLKTLRGVHARPSDDVHDMNAMHPSPRGQSAASDRSAIATRPWGSSKTPRSRRPGQDLVVVLTATGSQLAPSIDAQTGVAPGTSGPRATNPPRQRSVDRTA